MPIFGLQYSEFSFRYNLIRMVFMFWRLFIKICSRFICSWHRYQNKTMFQTQLNQLPKRIKSRIFRTQTYSNAQMHIHCSISVHSQYHINFFKKSFATFQLMGARKNWETFHESEKKLKLKKLSMEVFFPFKVYLYLFRGLIWKIYA